MVGTSVMLDHPIHCLPSRSLGRPRVRHLFGLVSETYTTKRSCAAVLRYRVPQSIGGGERYHQPLRSIFSVVPHDHPQFHPEVALRMCLKAMNDTMGPDALVPTLLVFGLLLTLPTTATPLASQQQRMAVFCKAPE